MTAEVRGQVNEQSWKAIEGVKEVMKRWRCDVPLTKNEFRCRLLVGRSLYFAWAGS